MDEQMVANPYNGVLPCNEKEWMIDTHVGKSQDNYTESKKPDKECVL